MTANLRYLHASFFSFCFHASIFLYLYGTFNGNSPQNFLISKPLQVELKFASEIQPTKKEVLRPKQIENTQLKKIVEQTSSLQSSESIESVEETLKLLKHQESNLLEAIIHHDYNHNEKENTMNTFLLSRFYI